MKNKNGITLIALIITIIVMLVLAGVAISSVVGENGVIDKVENANEKMEEKEILEQVQTSATYKLDGDIDLKQTYENVEKLFGQNKIKLISPTTKEDIIDSTVELELEIKGKRGEYLYTINNKKIDNYKGITLDKTEIELLMLGSNSTEQLVASLIGINDTIEWKINDESIATISAENNIATIIPLKAGETIITVKCGEYTATCNIIINTLEVGQEVYYDGDLDETKEKWYVYTIEDEKLEIISANVMYYPDGTRI